LKMFPPRTRGDLGRDIGLRLAKAIDEVVRCSRVSKMKIPIYQ